MKSRKRKALETPEEVKKVHSSIISIKSCAGYSLKGINPSIPDKENQDVFICRYLRGGLVCGVADGHGYYGEIASRSIKNHIESIEETNFGNTNKLFVDLHDSLKDLNANMQYSGSTLTLAVIEENLTVSHVGDSPAIIGSQVYISKNKLEWRFSMITKLHNLENREEAQRVGQNGGRITWGKPSRLWLRDEDVPGLAVTRAIGDFIANSVGVTFEPEVNRFLMKNTDKILIICSDGVTDCLSIEDIGKIVAPLWKENLAEVAAQKVVKKARENCCEDIIDDATCVVVYFD